MNANSHFKKIGGLASAFVFFVAFGFLTHRYLYEAPVLMYHHVDNALSGSSNFVSPESFQRQMEFLKVHRYRVVGLAELIREVKEKKTIPAKTVAITFDDGNLDNFQNAFPILKKMDFPATLFMISSNVGKKDSLSEEDLRILDGSNITIGSHTIHHAFLPELPPEEVKKELVNSREVLEKILGHEVTLFSYPAGGVTPEIERMVQEAGYVGAVTTNYGTKNDDPYALHRVKVGERSGNLFNFWFKLSGYSRWGKKHVEAVE